MGDLYGEFGGTRDPRFGPKSRQPTGLTPAQAALKPYVEAEKQDVLQERGKLGVLDVLLDVLQAGNYASANFADEVFNSVENNTPFPEAIKNTLSSAWKGLTLEKKQTYSDVLRNHLSDEQLKVYDQPIFGQGSFTGYTPLDVAGFIGDVFLDPTTYLTLGASKGAKAAANAYAKDTVKTWLKELSLGSVRDLAKKGFNEAKYKALTGKGDFGEALKYLKSFDIDIARQAEQVTKNAYKQALLSSGEDLRKGLSGRLSGLSNPAEAGQKALKKAAKTFGQDPGELLKARLGAEEAAGEAFSLKELVNRLNIPDEAGKLPYEQAGQASWGAFGFEVASGKSELLNSGRRAWQTFENWIGNRQMPFKKDVTFSDAWWSVMNKGPVGAVKKALGIKNPYQQILKNMALEQATKFASVAAKEVGDVSSSLGQFKDEDLLDVHNIISRAEKLATEKKPVTAFEILQNPGTYGMRVKDPEQAAQAFAYIRDKNAYFKAREDEWIKHGYFKNRGELENYLYGYWKDPNISYNKATVGSGYATGVTQKREYLREDAMELEMQKVKLALGVDNPLARDIVVNQNLSGYSTDIRELMTARAVMHAKMDAKAQLIEQFREFGVNLKNAPPLLREAHQIEQLGLQTVGSPAFEGYLFDNDVAAILNKTFQAIDDPSIKGFRQMLANYNSWWKGVALMGPSTKIRNFLDQQFTGYLKHGMKWFDIQKYDMPALAGTVFAANRFNPKKAGADFAKNSPMLNLQLNKQFGGYSVRDLMDYIAEKGVFSEMTMGNDVQKTVDQWIRGEKVSANPFNKDFGGIKISRSVDTVVENQSRIKSFLVTFDDLVKSGVSKQEALEYATMETKKWFVDYADLSEFEKKYLRNIVPFYTFVRKNLANKMQAILLHPDTYSMYPKLQELMESDDPNFDPDLIPAYMKNLGMFPVGETAEGFAMFNPGISMADLNKIPLLFDPTTKQWELSWPELKDDVIASSHPLVKTAMEMIPEEGYDTFRKRDLAETSRAPYTLRYFSKSPQLLGFLDGSLRLAGFDEGLKVQFDDDNKLQIDAKIARVIETNLPILRHIDNWLLGAANVSNQLVPGLQASIEAATGAKSDYEGMEAFFQSLAYFTAIKFKEADTEELKEDLRNEVYYGARDTQQKVRYATEEAQARRAGYKQRQDRIIRRLTGI